MLWVYELVGWEVIYSFPRVLSVGKSDDISWGVNDGPGGVPFVEKRKNFWAVSYKAEFPEDYFKVRVIDNKLLDKVDWGSRKEAA